MVHPPLVGLDPGDFETTGPLECLECPCEHLGPVGIITVGIYSIAGVKWLEGYIQIIELLLIFLMPAYFLLKPRETTAIDVTSCIPKVVDACSDILIDFLVVLARLVDTVPPSSPLEGLSIIMLLIDEMAFAGAAIRSWRGGSVNRAHRVGRSLILAVCSFEHYDDLGDFRHLLKPGELIGGHGQVGTWGLVDIMAIKQITGIMGSYVSSQIS